MKFQLKTSFKTSPGQKAAIDLILNNFTKKKKQTLLGITGSGKTFVMANIINQYQKPTLILAHNKTLAAQLYSELKNFFQIIVLNTLFHFMTTINPNHIFQQLIHT